MLQHLEEEDVASEACVVRQSSEAAPPRAAQNTGCRGEMMGLTCKWDNMTAMKHFTAN